MVEHYFGKVEIQVRFLVWAPRVLSEMDITSVFETDSAGSILPRPATYILQLVQKDIDTQ